jgi:hypothetical protein
LDLSESGDPAFVKSQFEEGYYPELEVYHCDRSTGKITKF